MNIISSDYGQYIGGLIGNISNPCAISQSYSTGSITAANSSYVGGFIGHTEGYGSTTINSCYTTGNVS